jgi:hypothetical protein
VKPFLLANPQIHSILWDGDPRHPGNGQQSAKAVNACWNEPVPQWKRSKKKKRKKIGKRGWGEKGKSMGDVIEIIAAPNCWAAKTVGGKVVKRAKTKPGTGNWSLGAQQKQGKAGPATTKGHAWVANSPDLNVAEHAVAAIVDKHSIAEGGYNVATLKSIARATFAAFNPNKGILTMPKRLAAVAKRKGGYCVRGEDW